jgi:hypothetical protein
VLANGINRSTHVELESNRRKSPSSSRTAGPRTVIAWLYVVRIVICARKVLNDYYRLTVRGPSQVALLPDAELIGIRGEDCRFAGG